MLVLTRKPGEEIVIEGVIRVTVLSVRGDRIRLGIEAPREVVVDRSEIHERRVRFGSPLNGPEQRNHHEAVESGGNESFLPED
jgi:carbon storage regulator